MSEPMTFQKKSRRECYIVRDDVVEPGGVEPPSKNLFLSASPSAEDCLNFPHKTDNNQTVILGSSNFMTIVGTDDCSRSPLIDALAKPRYSLFGRPPN